MKIKNNNTILWIVGIIILVILLINNYQKVQPEEGMIGLKAHYYKDGVEVFPTRGLFSLVTPPGGVYDQISFSIYGSNEGNFPITDIQVEDAFPLVFFTAVQSGTIYSNELAAGETNKLLWTSAKMGTTQFESISPVNFWIEVSGKSGVETIYPDRVYSGDISFVSYTPPTPSYWLDPVLDLTPHIF